MNILKLAGMLTLDGTRFKAGLKEAESAANKFGKDIGGSLKGELAAAFGGGALIAFLKDSLSSTAAEHMGLAFSDVAAAERQFNAHRREAVEKNEELRKTFEEYGFTLEDLQNPQLKFFDFLERANVAMKDMTGDQLTRSLSTLGDVLGEKVGPKLQELIKQLHEVKDSPIVDEQTINTLDEAGDKIGDLWRQAKGFVAIAAVHPVNTVMGVFAQQLATIGLGPKARGARADVSSAEGLGGAATKAIAGSGLFDDKIATGRREAFNKAQRDLQAAAMLFGLSKRAGLNAQLGEGMDFINEAEGAGGGPTTASLGARKDLLGILGQMSGLGGARPGVASLTSTGAWAGRNFAGGGDSPEVKAARELLGVAKTSDTSLKEINQKVKAGKTLIANP